MLSRFTDLRQGETVATWDARLGRWRKGRVLGVHPTLKLFTVEVGNVLFDARPIEPRYVRRIQLVYCRRCSELRRERRAA